MNKIRQTAGKTARVLKRFAVPAILSVFCVFLVYTFIVLRTGAVTILRGALYYPLGLLLPGYLLARTAARRDSSSELYGFSLLFGTGVAIVSYFLDSYVSLPVLPGRLFSCFLGPVLSVPSFFLLLRDVRSGRRDRKSLVPDGRILAVAAVAVMLSLGIKAWLAAVPADSVDVIDTPHIDVLWNTANMAALSHGWPADNIQYLGKLYKTNLFANIFRVSAGRFIGTRNQAEMMYVFSGLYLLPLLVFSLDSLGQSFTDGNRKRSFLFILIYLFVGYVSRALFFFYNPDWAYNAAFNNLWFGNSASNQVYAPNGSDLAIPGCALLLLLVRRICRDEKKLSASLWPALLVTAAITTGAKYVSVICVAGGIVGTALFRLIQGRGIRGAARMMVPLALIVAGFLPSYYGTAQGAYVYMPAASCEAEYMAADDPGYEQAREEYQSLLDREDFFYYLIQPAEGKDAPVVRQESDGDYYIIGKGLFRTRLDHDALSDIMERAENMRTDGIIGSAGGVYRRGDGYDSLLRVAHATGFVRYTEKDTGTPSVLFYGSETSMVYGAPDMETVMQNPAMAEPGLFFEGGDGTETTYEHAYSSLTINASMQSSKLYNMIIKGTAISGSPLLSILLFLLIPVHFLMARPLTAIPFACWMKDRMKDFRTIPAEDLAAGGAAVCGLIAYYVMSIDGNSQRYLFDTAILITDAAGAAWLCGHYKAFSRPVRRLLCFALALGLGTTWGLDVYRFRLGADKVAGMSVNQEAETLPGAYEQAPYAYITRYEMEAMDWIRENTPGDAVVATNRHYQDSAMGRYQQPQPNDYDSRYYYYAAYGERQIFLGSWAYLPRTKEMQEMLRQRLLVNDALFNPFCVNKREIMEAHGISYLVASAEAGTGMDMKDGDLDCVFRNRDIAVYTLSQTKAN